MSPTPLHWRTRADRCMYRAVDALMENMGSIMDIVMRFLGPFLILVASTIIYFLLYEFFYLVLPLLQHRRFSFWWDIHVSIAIFLLVNVIYNYVLCVRCKHGGEKYHQVLVELARVTDYRLPETEEDLVDLERKYETKIMEVSVLIDSRQEPWNFHVSPSFFLLLS